MRSDQIQMLELYVNKLCKCPSGRNVGRASNLEACQYFIAKAKEFGLRTQKEEFECIDWMPGDVSLEVEGESFTAFASTFSDGCNLKAALVDVSTLDELKAMDLQGKILLLEGEIAQSPLMPKNFVFYNPDEHKAIIAALEANPPLALITATPKNPELSGAVYPVPMFEDGDFDVPSVYLTMEEGNRLSKHSGKELLLVSKARRIKAKALNISAAIGANKNGRILICGHIDTKIGTPGALDNATGVATLISLMDRLRDYSGDYEIEFLPFNGEDNYAVPSQMLWLKANEDRISDVKLCINIDAMGLKDSRTGYCSFNLDEQQKHLLEKTFANDANYCEIEPWYQGDHSIFAMQGIAAIAFCSEKLSYLINEITHTENDVPELVEYKLVSDLADRITELLKSM